MAAKQSQRFQFDRLETPIGTALLVSDDEGFLRALDWSDYEERLHHLLRRHYGDYALDKAAAPKAFKSISGIEPAQPVLTAKPVVAGGKRVVKKPAREDAPF